MSSTTARGIKYPTATDPVANLETHFANLANTADSAITAAVAGKANTTHTHAIADVTGLQAALDGKAATSHKHPASAIGVTTEEFTVGTFPTNFANYDSANFAVWKFSRLTATRVATTGTVKATAAVAAAGATATAAGVIPANLRPPQTHLQILTTSNGGRVLVQLQADGAIRIYAYTALAANESFMVNYVYEA